jgi:hypothetical protein
VSYVLLKTSSPHPLLLQEKGEKLIIINFYFPPLPFAGEEGVRG